MSSADKQREISDMDQAIASIGDVWPRTAWSFFIGCKKEGFTRAESFELTKVMILQMTTSIWGR